MHAGDEIFPDVYFFLSLQRMAYTRMIIVNYLRSTVFINIAAFISKYYWFRATFIDDWIFRVQETVLEFNKEVDTVKR